jgi:hypothetical protein
MAARGLVSAVQLTLSVTDLCLLQQIAVSMTNANRQKIF